MSLESERQDFISIKGQLNLRKHASYASAEFGVSAVESFLRLFLLIYLTDKLGLQPQYAGYAVAIGVLWDAFADPLMGRISDRTRTRFGQRIPWIVLGTPLLALSFVFIFCLDTAEVASSQTLFWVVTGINILINSAMTIVSIPHLALGQDIAMDGHERTNIYAWRSFMTLIGLLAGILIPAMAGLLGIAVKEPERSFALVISLILLFSCSITAFTARKYIKHKEMLDSEPPIALGTVMSGPLLILNVSYFFATFGQGINSVIAMYYYRYSLKFSEQQLGGILIVFIFCLAGALPFWVYLSRRHTKVKLISIGVIGLGLLTSLTYPFFPEHSLVGPFVMAIVGGVLLGSTGLLESMLVDTAIAQGVEENAMGQVFGVWKFVAKSSRGLAIAAGGQLLAFAGYSASKQPLGDSVTWNIALLFGPVVGVFFILSGLVLVKILGAKKMLVP